MKTTLEMEDNLFKEVKIMAAHENRKLRDLVPELIKLGMQSRQNQQSSSDKRFRVKEPIFASKNPGVMVIDQQEVQMPVKFPVIQSNSTVGLDHLTPDYLKELELKAERERNALSL